MLSPLPPSGSGFVGPSFYRCGVAKHHLIGVNLRASAVSFQISAPLRLRGEFPVKESVNGIAIFSIHAIQPESQQTLQNGGCLRECQPSHASEELRATVRSHAGPQRRRATPA